MKAVLENDNSIKVTVLPVGQLDPNAWNPNEMTEDAFAELVAEVRRLGRLPKPIVVRAKDDRFEIVDGEHNWQAACKVGLKDVPCEIVEVDDFEAMRQTFKRNRHGEENPVLLGGMFEKMMKENKLSQRKLASQIKVSEGTIRNSRLYVKAAELRSSYAGQDATEEIEQLSQRQVRLFCSLPADVRNLWLDAGAPYNDAVQSMFSWVAESGLSDVFVTQADRFQRVTSVAIKFWANAGFYGRLVDRDAYFRPAIERLLSVDVMRQLPCSVENDQLRPLLTPAQWEEVLDSACAAPTDRKFFKRLDIGIHKVLREAGQDLRRVFKADEWSLYRELQRLPEYLRDADALFPAERIRLAKFTVPGVYQGMVLEAKRRTVEYFQRHPGSLIQRLKYPRLVTAVCDEQVTEMEKAARNDNASQHLSTREDALEAALAAMEKSPAIKHGRIGDRPAWEVLQERFQSLEHPELAMIASSTHRTIWHSDPGFVWLVAAGGEATVPPQSSVSELLTKMKPASDSENSETTQMPASDD